MLTVVHIAPNRETAEEIKSRLEAEGLLAIVRAVENLRPGERSYFELLVPQTEAEEAFAILNAPHRH